MEHEQEANSLRMALNQALRHNDKQARLIEKLKAENYSDYICGCWQLHDEQTVHIRKRGQELYYLSVGKKGTCKKTYALTRIDGDLRLFNETGTALGKVYYFPVSDLLLIEGIGLCSSIEKSDL